MDPASATGAVGVNRAASIELLFSDSMIFASLTTGITITDNTMFWFAPGIGIVREMYREERTHPDNDPGWEESDRWLIINLN